MQRRDFLKKTGAGSLALGSGLVASKAAEAKAEYKWKMVTTWPKNFPGLGTGAGNLAKLITEMSGGRYPGQGLWRQRAGAGIRGVRRGLARHRRDGPWRGLLLEGQGRPRRSSSPRCPSV